MNRIIAGMAVALTVCSSASHAQTPATTTEAASAPQPQATPSPNVPSATGGLNELDAMTFACPKAALNAAAREAAKVPSQGTYQFAFFKIVNDAHHAAYEVHFKSNYAGEETLKYCVAMYCQQGWDPKDAKAEVTLMTRAAKTPAAADHGAQCGVHRPAATGSKPSKR